MTYNKFLILIGAVALFCEHMAEKQRQEARNRFAILSHNRGVKYSVDTSSINTVEELVAYTKQFPRLDEIKAGVILDSLARIVDRQINQIESIQDLKIRQEKSEKLLGDIVDFSSSLKMTYPRSLFCEALIIQIPAEQSEQFDLKPFFRKTLLGIKSEDSLNLMLEKLKEDGAITKELSDRIKADWRKPISQLIRSEMGKSLAQNWEDSMKSRLASGQAVLSHS